MKTRLFSFAILSMLFSLVSLFLPDTISPSVAQSQPYAPAISVALQSSQLPPMAPGIVLVGLKPSMTMARSATGVQSNNATLNARLARLGARSVEPLFPFIRRPHAVSAVSCDVDLTHIYRLRLAPNADVLRAMQELQEDPSVAYAEPDYLAHVIATPNDPEYANQWGLAKINAPAAWDMTTGSNDVVIAVVDSGIDAMHPDLSGQLWTSPGEIAGNGIDDDSNGYVDDINGWNIIGNNADLSDNTGHGTQVAGVIAAATNNSTGVAGVCWNCRLMIVKVMQTGGIANYSDIAMGVAYAAQKGAKVINLSLGGNSDSATLKAAIASASSTAVIVGGAGNDDGSAVFYPAAYDDYVLAVAGTTSTDVRVASSNYGTWVDVSAPGEAIRTTFSGGTYADSSGTSMAAPFAAGLAGLLRSQNPTWSANLTRAQIVNTTDNIDSVNPGYAGMLGTGRINAEKAVTTAPSPQLSIVSYMVDDVTSGMPAPGSAVNLIVTIQNTWGTVTNTTGTLSTSDPYVTITNASASFGNIDAYAIAANTTSFVLSVLSSAPYAHEMPFSLTVDGAGGFNVVLPLTITTQNGIVNVSGVIANNTTWTNDKTFVVTGNIMVASGVTLTIEAGTTVRFDPAKTLQVNGTLVAIGQPNQKIQFTSDETFPSAGDWDGIQFNDISVDAEIDDDNQYVSGNTLQHVIVEYATKGVLCANASPYLGHNAVRFNSGTGIQGGESAAYFDSYPVIVYNEIEENGNGLQTGNAITVTNNRVVNNLGWGIFADRGGTGRAVSLSQNLIVGNGGDGLRVWANDVFTITDNTILGNNIGVSLEGGGSPSTFFFSHNNLIENDLYDFKNNIAFNIDVSSNWWGTVI